MQELQDPLNQRNITVIVGNGFDLSVLNHYRQQLTTSYKSFYYYLRSINFSEDNLIFGKMIDSKRKNAENWSDFEAALETLTSEFAHRSEKILADLSDIQSHFSAFLNSVITPGLVTALDHDSQIAKWAYRSHSEFLADLSETQLAKCYFPTNLWHGNCFNFNFFNLNYTPLLDIYLHLDRYQYNPRHFITSDRNFWFRINPDNVNARPSLTANSQTGCAAYLRTKLYHPHGQQNIPRSLLFGTGEIPPDPTFSKGHWAQLEYKYKGIMEATDLFIVFGASLGNTDSWWWKSIAHRISEPNEKPAEAIIYQFDSGRHDRRDRRNKIIDTFKQQLDGFSRYSDQTDERIHSVLYSSPYDISFLGLKPDPFDPEFRKELTYRRPPDHWTSLNDIG